MKDDHKCAYCDDSSSDEKHARKYRKDQKLINHNKKAVESKKQERKNTSSSSSESFSDTSFDANKTPIGSDKSDDESVHNLGRSNNSLNTPTAPLLMTDNHTTKIDLSKFRVSSDSSKLLENKIRQLQSREALCRENSRFAEREVVSSGAEITDIATDADTEEGTTSATEKIHKKKHVSLRRFRKLFNEQLSKMNVDDNTKNNVLFFTDQLRASSDSDLSNDVPITSEDSKGDSSQIGLAQSETVLPITPAEVTPIVPEKVTTEHDIINERRVDLVTKRY